MIAIIAISVLFCFITIGRLFAYNRKYHLPESKYTKLFRVITKEQMAGMYMAFVAVSAGFGIWIILNI
jgi:hypothetical protein